jgi:hypothetical protein
MLDVASSPRVAMQDIAHISWMPDGRSFKIRDCAKFAKQTLPKFFAGIQYKSFIRQLNIYGFERVKDRKSPLFGQYSHPYFVRGEPDLCLFMTRQKIKGTGVPRGTKKNVLLSWEAQHNKALIATQLAEDALMGNFHHPHDESTATTVSRSPSSSSIHCDEEVGAVGGQRHPLVLSLSSFPSSPSVSGVTDTRFIPEEKLENRIFMTSNDDDNDDKKYCASTWEGCINDAPLSLFF